MTSKDQKKRTGKTNQPKLTTEEKQARKTKDKERAVAKQSARAARVPREPVRVRLTRA